jgi:methylmalonyl-CoA mutase N-terminal domain/subunit
MGGAVASIEKGFMQKEIVESAYRFQKEVEAKKRIIVGVNEYKTEEETRINTLQIDPAVEKNLVKRLNQIKRDRNQGNVSETLGKLRWAAGVESTNLMPFILQAVNEYATVGEICGVLREVFGEYKAPSIF